MNEQFLRTRLYQPSHISQSSEKKEMRVLVKENEVTGIPRMRCRKCEEKIYTVKSVWCSRSSGCYRSLQTTPQNKLIVSRFGGICSLQFTDWQYHRSLRVCKRVRGKGTKGLISAVKTKPKNVSWERVTQACVDSLNSCLEMGSERTNQFSSTLSYTRGHTCTHWRLIRVTSGTFDRWSIVYTANHKFLLLQ